MERELERLREKSPEPTQYDRHLEWMQERSRLRNAGKVIIKADEAPWQLSRHGYHRIYVNCFTWDQVGAPGWEVPSYMQATMKRGKHTHRGGGRLLYVVEGHGCTVNNDITYEWEAGDLEILPVTRFENSHEHFNLDPTRIVRVFAPAFWPMMECLAYETRQVTDSPEWTGPKNERIYRPDDFIAANAQVEGYEIKFNGPPKDLLDDLFLRRNRWREMMSKARWIVKKNDQPLEINRMGIYRWYVHPSFTDVAARHLLFWTQEIPPGSRSGKQKQQGGRVHLVEEGRGYTIIDGVKHEWEKDDLMLLPIKSGGVVFQHFNADPERPVKLAVSEPNWYDILGVDLACGFEQLENAPEYQG